MSKIDNVTQETKSLSLFHLLILLLLITFTTSCLRLRDGSADWIIPLGTKRRLEHRQWRELAKRIHTAVEKQAKVCGGETSERRHARYVSLDRRRARAAKVPEDDAECKQ